MKKFENFCKAMDNLEDIYKYEEPYDNVVLIGLVALYEICFEQSWKAMKEVLYENGIKEAAAGSPRSIIKLAYSVKLIEDQEVWLDALVSRNNVAHAYNQAIAMDIVKNTKERYAGMFRELRDEIRTNWI
ncbi:HI0074 family nucleotidyltransferase substrate-binding subunit [Anaerostipes sp.]|uniref:HI0074 family nucleotidyltransferase substrate-binding subunit n=1 Tax=Anaerostipes sp. TaxID=1872530 RepID=UPI0025BC85A7|nr:HI0074 family nucleotidyltransferase substrate-binding subunit [Anaerostipes sp.]MBS7008881.1 HI0074 family nucleotidyltransferase substrate-binding subunit [Anaerostipes sp.]